VATDPSDLPFELSGKTAVSSALTRCTQPHQDRAGRPLHPWGSRRSGRRRSQLPASDRGAAGTATSSEGQIHRNEVSIGSGYTSAKWSAIKYNSYNVTTQSIFAVERYEQETDHWSTVAGMGNRAPATAPTLTGNMTNGRSDGVQQSLGYAEVSGRSFRQNVLHPSQYIYD